MPAIKPTASISEKWSRVTPKRTTDYRQGVENPRRSWEEGAAQANDRYVEGVTAAAQAGRYERGIRQAGDEKWQRKAATLGSQRWGPGVQAAKDDYARGFAPFRDVIERTTLPPRYPKGDPRNIERVAAIATALHQQKVSG